MGVHRPKPFRAQDKLDGCGADSEVAEAALALTPAQATPPIEVDGQFVVLYLIERSETDPEDYKGRIPALKQAIRGQKIQAYVGKWYESLKAVSRIEDNRSQS